MTDPPRASPPDALLLAGVWVYLFLLVGGVFLFRTPLAMPAGAEVSMSLPRAVMTVTNAGTLTGFQTTLSNELFRPPAQWALLALTLAGAGVSWVIAGALAARALRLEIGVGSLAMASGVMLVIAVIVGVAVAGGTRLFDSVFRAVSAVTQSGLWIGPPPRVDAPVTLALWLPLGVLGGLGALVLADLARWVGGRGVSRFTLVVLTLTSGAYLIGVAMILGADWLSGRLDAGGSDAWKTALVHASAQSINARSVGLPLGSLGELSRPTQWMTALLMLAGGSTAGAGGGIKLTTLLVLWAGVTAVLRGQPPGRIVGIAAVWAVGYLLAAFVVFVLLLRYVPEMPADRLLMLSISALGNAGLSHDAVSIPRLGAYVLSSAMLVGRLAPLLVLWWIARLPEKPDVAVG